MTMMSSETQVERAVRIVTPELVEGLNVEEVLPRLYSNNVLTQKEYENLQNESISSRKKAQRIGTLVSKKGCNAFTGFVKSLQATDSGTCHGRLAEKLLAAYKTPIGKKPHSKARRICDVLISPKLKYLCVVLAVILMFISVPAIIGDYDYIILRFPNSKTLPPPIKNFVGRQNELENLTLYLDFEIPQSFIRIIGIFGSPGFGKSSLAIQAVRRIPSTVQVIYIDMSTIKTLDKLAIRIYEHSNFSFTDENIFYRAILEWGDKLSVKTVLLLDNCDEILGSQKNEFQSILKKLCQNEKHLCKVMFTSQEKVSFVDEEFEYIHVDTLPRNDTIKLLKKIVPRMSEKDSDKVANIVGDMPLAAKIIAAIIRIEKVSISEIVNQFIAHKNSIIKKLSPREFPMEDRIATCLTIAYQNLKENTRRCARLLAKFPGSFSHSAADYIIHFPYNVIRRHFQTSLEIPCIEELVSKSFMEKRSYPHDESRYNFHQLIRTFLNNVDENRMLLTDEAVTFKLAFIAYYKKVMNIFESLIFEVLFPAEENTTAIQTKSHPVVSVENLSLKFMEADGHNVELYFEYLTTYFALEYFYVEISISILPKIIKNGLFKAAYLSTAHAEINLFNKSSFLDTTKEAIINEGKQLSLKFQVYISWMELYEVVLKQLLPAKEYFKLYLYLLLYNTWLMSDMDTAIELSNKRIDRLLQLSNSINDNEHVLLTNYLLYSAVIFRDNGRIDAYIKYYSIVCTLRINDPYDKESELLALYASALIEYGKENYMESIELLLQITEKTEYIVTLCYVKVLLYHIYQNIGELSEAEEMKEYIFSSDTEESLVIKIKDIKDIEYESDIILVLVFYYMHGNFHDSEFFRLASDMYMQTLRNEFNLENALDYEYLYPLE